MNGTCSSCTHWTQDDEGSSVTPLPVSYGDGSDYFERVAARNADVGLCNAAVFAPDVELDDPVPLLMVRDGSDYRASLYTRRDFGCLLHEQRSTSDTPTDTAT